MERMVEGVFTRAFKGKVRPIDLGRRLVREMDDNRTVDVRGRTIVPNHFTFHLAPDDVIPLTEISDPLIQELVDAAREHANDEGYAFLGPGARRAGRRPRAEGRPLRDHRRGCRPAPVAARSCCRAARGCPSATAWSPSAACPSATSTSPTRTSAVTTPSCARAGTSFVVVDLALDQRHPGERRARHRAGAARRRHHHRRRHRAAVRGVLRSTTGRAREPARPSSTTCCSRCCTSSSPASCGRCGPRCGRPGPARRRPGQAAPVAGPGAAAAAATASIARPAPPVVPAPAAAGKREKRSKGPAQAATTLVVRQPPERAGATYPIAPEMTIGRAAGCHVSVPTDTYVSNLHARVFQADGQIFVEDLGSTNGTFVNGARISGPTAVQAGDRIQAGRHAAGAGVMVELRYGSATDTGRVRAANEDSLLVAEPLFAVADGMGGHAGRRGGQPGRRGHARARPSGPTTRRASHGIVEAVRQANRDIVRQSLDSVALRGMGTTLTGIALVGQGDDSKVAVFNVGDSRTYLLRRRRPHAAHHRPLLRPGAGRPRRDLAGRGPRAPAPQHRHPRARHRGGHHRRRDGAAAGRPATATCSAPTAWSTSWTTPRSSGCWPATADPQAAADELARLANASGGRDNITVIVVDVVDGDAGGALSEAADGDGVPGPRRPRSAGGSGDDQPTARRRQRRPAADQPARPSSTPPRRRPAAEAPPRPAARQRSSSCSPCSPSSARPSRAISWYGRGGYYVGFDGDQVAVYQGRPGGVLWIDPTLAGTVRRSHRDRAHPGRPEPHRGQPDLQLARGRRRLRRQHRERPGVGDPARRRPRRAPRPRRPRRRQRHADDGRARRPST